MPLLRTLKIDIYPGPTWPKSEGAHWLDYTDYVIYYITYNYIIYSPTYYFVLGHIFAKSGTVSSYLLNIIM